MDGGYPVSQFGGGGFIAGGSQEAVAAPAASPQQTKKYSNNQTLRAVTVKQLVDGTANTPDDQYKVDGVDLDNVTLVGKILSVQEQATNLTIVLDDGTGRVELKYWIDSDETEQLAQRKAQWKEGVYVRVHGHLRAFGGEKSIVAFSIRPVTDFNEVTYHGLQVIFQHLHITKGNAFPAAGGVKPEAPSPMQIVQQNGYAAAANGAGVDADGMNPVQKAVSDVLASSASVSEGLTIEEIASRLGNKYDVQAIQQTMTWMLDEGHAYTPGDNRFRTTAC